MHSKLPSDPVSDFWKLCQKSPSKSTFKWLDHNVYILLFYLDSVQREHLQVINIIDDLLYPT